MRKALVSGIGSLLLSRENRSKGRPRLERLSHQCTGRGGSPTVREGMDSMLTPFLTVGLPPHTANPVHAIDNRPRRLFGLSPPPIALTARAFYPRYDPRSTFAATKKPRLEWNDVTSNAAMRLARDEFATSSARETASGAVS